MGFKNLSALLAGSSSSTISLPSSAAILPPLSLARAQGSALQASLSLQDFATYDKVDTSDDVSAVHVSGAADVERPLVYHGQEEGSVYTPKGSKNSNLIRTGYWCKLIASWVLGGLVLFLLYFGYHWCRRHWTSEELQYSIVLDCGSTSTRVQVYAWTYKDSLGDGQLPLVIHPKVQSDVPISFPVRKGGQRKESRAYHRMESEPGLHKLLSNATGIKAALEPLLQWAEQQVPRADHGRTPLFLLATAGMRSLESEDADWLLDKAWAVLERSPFLCQRSWVKVISGAEEAYYGWVSLNYNFGRLGQTTRQPTFGALDLGGSSLQVTFESEEVQNKEYEVNLSVGTTDHHLYAFSHAGFGLNDAFDKSVALVLEQRQGSLAVEERERHELEHPCLHTGFRKQYKCVHCKFLSKEKPVMNPDPIAQQTALGDAQTEFTLVGNPDWESCKLLASAIVNNASRFLVPPSSHSVDCSIFPCALGNYEPVPHQGKFYALSGFFVVYKFFGLQPDAGFSELLRQGQGFCEKPWKVALDSVVPQPLIEHYCFRAPYVVSLLQDGLHLKEEQITVGSGDMTWTLGAALLEAGAFTPSKGGPASRHDGFRPASRGLLTWDAGIIIVFLLIMIVLILFTVTYFVNCVPFMGLKVQSTLSSLGSPRFFALLLTQFRFGKVETALRNGEGRVKMPHSPAPIGTSQDQSQRYLQLAAGKSMLETSEGQQIVAGYKPGSKLSSRRTQSRDDLIKYSS